MKRRTLDRMLSQSGVGSRTEARRFIADGRIRVNNEVIRDPEHWIDPARHHVTFDGQPLGEQASFSPVITESSLEPRWTHCDQKPQ